ncbi:MAG: OadG family protein [Lachnospiraceae bacterium]|nr:OadG family protein [Lachnospiraceae bacterium]
MRKRILLILSALVLGAMLMVSCSQASDEGAGGSSAQVVDDDTAMIYAENIVSLFYRMNQPDQMYYDLDQMLPEMERTAPVWYQAYLDFNNLTKDVGGFSPDENELIVGSEILDRGPETMTVSVRVKGLEREATIDIVIDEQDIQSVSMNPEYTFGEQMVRAGMNTLIGMGTVFVVLILISLIISLFGVLSKVQEAGKSAPAESEKELPHASPAHASVVLKKETVQEEENMGEIVAVIAAAIAAYEGSADPSSLVIRNIRRLRRG